MKMVSTKRKSKKKFGIVLLDSYSFFDEFFKSVSGKFTCFIDAEKDERSKLVEKALANCSAKTIELDFAYYFT